MNCSIKGKGGLDKQSRKEQSGRPSGVSIWTTGDNSAKGAKLFQWQMFGAPTNFEESKPTPAGSEKLIYNIFSFNKSFG